jgi:hypothetical protein
MAWLDATAAWAAAGASTAEIRASLAGLLEGQVAGEDSHSARGKTITVLLHIWVLVPLETRPLRDQGLLLLQHVAPPERLVLHWGMLLATYPFFRDVAAATGLLLDLQCHVTLAQLTRRLTEQWGQRSTLVRAVRRVARSFVEWGVLRETGEKGIYERGSGCRVGSAERRAWLVEAALRAEGSRMLALRRLLAGPALFPFQFSLTALELRGHPRLDVFRQGLDEEMLVLTGS